MTGTVLKPSLKVSKLCLVLLLGTVCVVGDQLVEGSQGSVGRFYVAFFDNLTHAIVAAIATLIVVTEFSNRITIGDQRTLVCGAFILAALVDADHFLEAHTLKLSEATHLDHRPFMHCSNIPIILAIIFIVCVNFRLFRLNVFVGMMLLAIATHQTRDAVRRGFWIRPYGETAPIPYALYVAISMALPFGVIAMLNAFQQQWDVRKQQYRQGILSV